MPSTRDIRRRIKSVKNTAQITKAMQLVAASKMKKAQDQAMAGRAYADLLNKVLVNLKDQTEADTHPLLSEREDGRDLILLITTDKGLCGGLNANLLRKVTESAAADAAIVTIGSKGRRSMARLKKDLLADFHIHDPVPFAETKTVSKFIIDTFLEGGYRSVKVGFTNFINTISQQPLFETLLPIRPIDLGRDKDYVGMGKEEEATALAGKGPGSSGYIFEPTPESVLDTVVPLYVHNEVYQMTLESRASEHSARMVAMKGATDNAEDLIKDLSLAYNKQRQAAITSELLEITTAMKALE
ncbi:MAG: F-type H+-transporting ATPase subunit gamma [Verrucomicrobiales bacterium]|jgi:F-type H+-transporting ATPase subunit gamma